MLSDTSSQMALKDISFDSFIAVTYLVKCHLKLLVGHVDPTHLIEPVHLQLVAGQGARGCELIALQVRLHHHSIGKVSEDA